jgi:hypothetical protein
MVISPLIGFSPMFWTLHSTLPPDGLKTTPLAISLPSSSAKTRVANKQNTDKITKCPLHFEPPLKRVKSVCDVANFDEQDLSDKNVLCQTLLDALIAAKAAKLRKGK